MTGVLGRVAFGASPKGRGRLNCCLARMVERLWVGHGARVSEGVRMRIMSSRPQISRSNSKPMVRMVVEEGVVAADGSLSTVAIAPAQGRSDLFSVSAEE